MEPSVHQSSSTSIGIAHKYSALAHGEPRRAPGGRQQLATALAWLALRRFGKLRIQFRTDGCQILIEVFFEQATLLYRQRLRLATEAQTLQRGELMQKLLVFQLQQKNLLIALQQVLFQLHKQHLRRGKRRRRISGSRRRHQCFHARILSTTSISACLNLKTEGSLNSMSIFDE